MDNGNAGYMLISYLMVYKYSGGTYSFWPYYGQ